MTNKNDAAYCLVPTGLTQTAIFSPTLKPNEKRKVNVKNSAHPFDEMVVDSWISEDQGYKYFHYEDGKLGDDITIPFDDAVRQMLNDD
ncbi:MAG: hypothetical protein Q7K26_06310 [bacterium]|nr:hypothetical protein [bacterium]